MHGRGGPVVATWHRHRRDDGTVECAVCPHRCRLGEGQPGRCGVRAGRGGGVVLTAYGRATGFAVEPIERQGLYHFLPGSPVLAVGTAGDNLNPRIGSWDEAGARSARAGEPPAHAAAPEEVAALARELGCAGVVLGSGEPTVVYEYALDVARACRGRGLKALAVSGGYICSKPRAALYRHVDAAGIVLRAFSERFYRRHCGGARLGPVLETLVDLRRGIGAWLEVTVPLVAGENDSPGEFERLARWLMDELGPDVPLHFTAYRPGWSRPGERPTPPAALRRARAIARANGLRHVYVDEPHAAEERGTRCHRCGELLVGRGWRRITAWGLTRDGRCRRCGTICPGVFGRPPEPGRGVRRSRFRRTGGSRARSAPPSPSRPPDGPPRCRRRPGMRRRNRPGRRAERRRLRPSPAGARPSEPVGAAPLSARARLATRRATVLRRGP